MYIEDEISLLLLCCCCCCCGSREKACGALVLVSGSSSTTYWNCASETPDLLQRSNVNAGVRKVDDGVRDRERERESGSWPPVRLAKKKKKNRCKVLYLSLDTIIVVPCLSAYV